MEKRVDIVGKTAQRLDTKAFAGILVIEGLVLANSYFSLNLERSSTLISLYNVYLALPFNIIFFALGAIKAAFEIVNLKRIGKLLYRIEKRDESAKDKLDWIRKRYFDLSAKETRQLNHLLSRTRPELREALREKIKAKILENKFEALQRRVTPGLAKEVKKEINTLIQNISSQDKKTQLAAALRTNFLLESLSRQAKNMLIIHSIGLIAIVLTIASVICAFAGVTSPAFFIALFAISVGLMALQYLLKKGTVDLELDKFYDKLNQFSLYKEAFESAAPSSLEAPLQ